MTDPTTGRPERPIRAPRGTGTRPDATASICRA